MFKAILVTIVLLSLTSFLIAYPEEGLIFNFTNEGLNTFYSTFELPIKFSFSSISVVAIWAAVVQAGLQRKSFIYSVFQTEADALKDYINSCSSDAKLENISSYIDQINYRQLMKCIVGSPSGATDYSSEKNLKRFATKFRNRINNFSTKAEKGKFSEQPFTSYIESVSLSLGIPSEIDDKASAIETERMIAEFLEFIAYRWFNSEALKNMQEQLKSSHH